MNRLEAHFDLSGWRWGLLFLITMAAGAEEQRGRAIEFSPSRSGAAITNRTAANRQQLQEDMLEQQLRDRITKPFRPNQDSLDAVMTPPPAQQRGLSPAEIRRIKEKISQRNNWMFADPDAIGKNPSGDSSQDTSANEETGLEKDSLTALKRFYKNKNAGQMQGTNGTGGGESDQAAEEDGDGLSGKGFHKTGTRDDFSKNPGGDSTPKGWFGTQSSRELDSSDQSSAFPDAFSPTAFISFERSAADIQRNNEFKKLLDSGPSAGGLGSLGNSSPAVSPLSSILGGSASAPTMNTMPGYKPNPITSLSPAASGPLSSTTPMLSLPPPFRPPQFKPVLPPRRMF